MKDPSGHPSSRCGGTHRETSRGRGGHHRGDHHDLPRLRCSPCAVLTVQQRHMSIVERFQDGQTLQEIATAEGCSRQRIHQIVSKAGYGRHDGGKHVELVQRELDQLYTRNQRCLEKWGHSRAAHQQLLTIGRNLMRQGVSHERTPIGAFQRQRENAHQRGLEWKLTLAEWWAIWVESGKWNARGRHSDAYVMSRYEDKGPYAKWNVFIQPASVNCSQARTREYFVPAA